MEVLREQAATYDECVAKIHKLHGTNVQILRKEQVRVGGFLGFFETTAIELSFTILRDMSRFPLSSSAPSAPSPRHVDFDEERKKILRQAAQTSPEMASRVAPHLASIENRPTAQPAQQSSRVTESQSLDTILKAVKKLEARLDRNSDESEARSDEHETLVKLESILDLNDFSSAYTRQLLSRVKKEFSLEELDRFEYIQDAVLEWIGNSIVVHESAPTTRPRVIVLVGPTGVGKTTTVAKLAAAYSLAAARGAKPLNVRVITIDNYRIGAKQQIEIYGNIMNIPVSCAETPSDLKTLMAMYAEDVDIVLIDTIGKSPKDYTKIAEMRLFLDAAGPISDVHLAMSATTKLSDMREIMQQYETFGYRSVIITKFDETTRVGNIISALAEKQKPLAYLTTGQRVPQDFEQASVVRFLTNLEGFRVNRTRIEELFPLNETRFEWR